MTTAFTSQVLNSLVMVPTKEPRNNFLTKETFAAIGISFVPNITSEDLAAAICAVESGHQIDAAKGTAGAIYNRTLHSGFTHKGVQQDGLPKNDQLLLNIMTSRQLKDEAKHQFEVIDIKRFSDIIVDTLKGNGVKSQADIWKATYSCLTRSSGADNPVGTRCFWVNVGKKHKGKDHITEFKNKSGETIQISSDMHGGCYCLGGLCFRDSYKATKPVED